MAKCDSQGFVVKADQVGKLKNQDIIAISVLDDLASCAKIDARTINANTTNLVAAYYNAANVPEDMFGCSKNSCYNTGTYQGSVKTTKSDVIIGDFFKTVDATLYANGIVTVYFYLPEGEHEVHMDVAGYTEADWSNYDRFTQKVYATQGDALYPVKFDLTEVAAEGGNGWTPDQIGVKLRFTINGTNLSAGDKSGESGKADADLVGVSSIAFYEGLEDLELNKTIIATCIDTWGDSQSFDVIEGACATSEYDPNSGTMTANITLNKYTENMRYLNPTLYKTEDSEFGILKIVTRTVSAGTGDLEGYGIVQLSDMMEDCGFVYVQTPGCANNSSELTRVNAPVPVIDATDSTLFQVLSTAYKGDASLGMVIVGKDWIGQDLNFIYRKKVSAEVWEVTNEFRDFHANILAPLRKKSGEIEWHYYENAFVTALNTNISRSDETSVELQFTIAADENGVRKKIAKITEA